MNGSLDYRVVDVFTDRAYAGNPLAVVLGGDGLTTEAMQAIAREFNLSETTFPVAPGSGDATYRLRIFTPTAELPFAGHPSIGSAWVMRQLGRVAEGRIVQECGAGLLPLVIDGDRVTLTGGPPTLGPAVPEATALQAVGLGPADFVGDPLRWAGTGIEFGFLHVRPDALARCRPDTGAMLQLQPTQALSVFSFADGLARARVFTAGLGVPEDPATGSAALGLGVWLAATGLVPPDADSAYVVQQGVEMGRASRLECSVRTEAGTAVALQVRGEVVPVAEGRIRTP